MKKRHPVAVALLVSFALALAASAADRTAQWKAVDEAMQEGLPKTAIERLGPIIEGAMAEKAYAEAIKAIGRRIALEGNIQGNKPEEKIVRMQAEVDQAPAGMKPVMEAVLANWYWHYFQQNRWRFLQRTRTAEPPGPDIRTWALPRILAEIGAPLRHRARGGRDASGDPDRPVRRAPGEGHDARRLPPHPVRLRRARSPGLLPGGRAGGRRAPRTRSTWRPTAPCSRRRPISCGGSPTPPTRRRPR